jgi:hypothetical protein
MHTPFQTVEHFSTDLVKQFPNLKISIMKKTNLLIAGMIALGSLSAYAQKSSLSASSLVAKAHQQEKIFSPSNMLISEESNSNLRTKLSSSLSEFGTFTLNKEQLRSEKQGSTDYIQLSMPLPDGSSAQLELVKVNIIADDFKVMTPTGTEAVETGQHYRGIINNDFNSLAAISIFDNEISGTLSIPEKGDYTIGLIQSDEERSKGTHIIYNTKLYRGSFPNWDCQVKDDNGIPYSARQLSSDVNAAIGKYVRLYYETEYDMYTSLGSTSAVSTFMVGLHNQVATLYGNEGISTVISGLYIWTSTDPYNGASASANLTAFKATRVSFSGDLGQLVTFRSIGGGIAAGFSGLCNSVVGNRLSTSQLYNFYNTVPTYSWSVDVVTHEFGHLFGSRHTHACVWNGNNTAIDGCAGSTEGGCTLPGVPAAGGTIMSYCHISSVGKNFSLGFGPQPGSVIRSSVANASCLNTNCPISNPVSGIDCYAQVNCGWTSFNTYPRRMGDVNGDGKEDIVGFGAAGVYYSLSTGGAFAAPVFALANFGTAAGGWTNFETYPREVADVNGDGRADIIGFGGAGVYVSYSTGAGFSAPVFVLANYSAGAGGWVNYNTYPRKMGDVNGDGRADIIGFGAAGVYYSLSTGGGFAAPVFALANFATGAGGWTNYNTYPREVGDVNGDGRADIIGFGGAGVYVSYSTGAGFSAPVYVLATYGAAAGGWTSHNTYPRAVGDINGDGRADIAGFGAAGVYVSLSTGTGFGAPAFLLANYGTAAGGWTSFDLYPRMLADVNGGGKDDIVGFGVYSAYVSFSYCNATGMPLVAPLNASDILDENAVQNFIANDNGNLGNLYTTATGNLSSIPSIEQEKQSNITIYPNPARDNLNINGLSQPGRLEIVNVLGQIVLEKNTTGESLIINVEDMKSGLYYIQFYNNEGKKTESKKLMLE